METIEWITGEADLAALAGEWDAVLPADPTPFDLHAWYVSWWRAFGGEAELSTCVLRRDGRLAGVFPLCREGGGGLRPLVNAQASRFRPLAGDPEALEVLCAAVLREAGRGFEVPSLPSGDVAVGALLKAAPGSSKAAFFEAQYASPFVETDGDFDAWRAASKKRWGAPLERFRRKMARDHEAELSIVERPADIEEELASGFQVEASGWKGREGTAIISTPETETFYRELGHALDGRAELYLSRIVLDGEVAAFDYCVLLDRRLFLLKTGFDERFRRLAPGLVMRLSIIEKCFETGLRSHELLGTESEWKMKFATGTREFGRVRAESRSPLGLARAAYRAGLRPRLKRAYRRLRSTG